MDDVPAATSRPTRKDIAEFYRLALLSGLCTPTQIVTWADLIVAADEHPDDVFLDLACCGRMRLDAIRTLLGKVPGAATSNLPGNLLLGHACRVLDAGGISAPELLVRILELAKADLPGPDAANELDRLDDALFLARDDIYGPVEQVYADFARFLNGYAGYGSVFPG